MAMSMLSDQPNQEDSLNFSKYIETLSDIIVNSEILPLTIGIFGDWGSGKTTLMRMLQEKVSTHCRTIWFNAWKYDDKQFLSKALLKIIHDRVMESDDLNLEMVKDILKRLANFAGQTFSNKKLGTIFFETFSLDPYYVNLLEETTQTLIKEYVGKRGRLIIFVDDLDRCLPENAITILETIKLYLDNENCIVVLAVDRGTIEKSIQIRYPNLEITGKDYLEKIIQIPFTIPQPEKNALRKYLQISLQDSGFKFEDNNPLAENLLSGSALNMRRLKRLVNQLNLVLEISNLKSAELAKIAVLVKLLVLQTRFPSFYDVVTNHPDAIHLFHQFLTSKNTEAQNRILKRLPTLKFYTDNQPLVKFFSESAQTTCPDPNEVRELLQLTLIAQ